MSLFQAREWWATQCGAGEEFDGGCLCVGNLEADPDGAATIFTGSLQGVLRMYQPSQRAFDAKDLLLEQPLDQAILQLELGRFSTAGGLQLAVLHPRKLAVFAVQCVGAQYWQVMRLYEHHMEHTAANMCYGSFGGARGVDNVCVQSFDGQLNFFECEVFSFARFLPGFLVPGPIAYVEGADLLITCSASLELEAYRYQALAAASSDKHEPAGSDAGQDGGLGLGSDRMAGIAAGKRVQAEWRVVLGEAAISICAGQLSTGTQAGHADVVVLAEHHFFVVSTAGGQLVMQARLDYHPAAACLYPLPASKAAGSQGPHALLVASHNRTLAVYRGQGVAWAASAPLQPVALAVAALGSPLLRGLVVVLDDAGRLAVTYMGTEPITPNMAAPEAGRRDYVAMAAELKHLTDVIRGGRFAGQAVTGGAEARLVVRAQVPAVWDRLRDSTGLGLQTSLSRPLMSSGGRPASPARRLTVRLTVTCQGSGSGLDDVALSVRLPTGIEVEQDSWALGHIAPEPGDPAVVLLQLAPAAPGILPPSSRTLAAVATAVAPGGEPRTHALDVPLPLCLFASLVPPVKAAEFKITVSTNQDAPALTALFEDLAATAPPSILQGYASSGANVLTFSVCGAADVTLLVSKNSGRYRLQSVALEAMWLILTELVLRLEAYFGPAGKGGGAHGNAPPLQWSYDEPLPLKDVEELVDGHWAARLRCRDLRSSLEARSEALRAVEKRLLMRFKEQHPAPLCQLDVLLEDSYRELQETAAHLAAAEAAARVTAAQLSGALQLLLLLTRLKFALPEAEVGVLEAALAPDALQLESGLGRGSVAGDVGWEEVAEVGLTQVLRSCLARNRKEAGAVLPPLAPSHDTSRLKRLMALVLERLSKGQAMVLGDCLPGQGTLAHDPDAEPG